MSTPPSNRSRGRGRGGFGKYMRARGRRGAGRPAEFVTRLRLEDEEEDSGSDDEEEGEDAGGDEGEQGKYAKRKIGTNADRYEEPEVDPHVEEEPEPEVDLSAFLARQRLDLGATAVSKATLDADDDDEIDHTLSHLPSTSAISKSRKNNVHTIEWDASLDELKREKEAAEAVRDLKARFRKTQPRLLAVQTKQQRNSDNDSKVADSRHLSNTGIDLGTNSKPPIENEKAELEDFLDDLLG